MSASVNGIHNPNRTDAAAAAVSESLLEQTRDIIHFCISSSENPSTPLETSLKNTCDEFKRRNVKVFEEMFASLEICDANGLATFLGVVNELFSEGITWSRVMAYLTFSSLFAAECSAKQLHSLRNQVPDWTNKYMEENLLAWISDHGGWDGFLEHFNNEDHRDPINLKTILCGVAAGALGAFTIGAYLASKT